MDLLRRFSKDVSKKGLSLTEIPMTDTVSLFVLDLIMLGQKLKTY